MSTLRHGVHSRLDPVAYRQLRQEAAARGVSLAACIADCLREYSALRAEMASAVTAAGEPGTPHTGLIHSLLARTEQRVLATLEAHASELGDDLRLLHSMVDRLVQLYLLHTPDVARELHAGAVASANRRYATYRQAVSELLAGSRNGAERGTRREEGTDE